ncbi:MAG: endo alpha-1,4 polygalactosaminidase [Oscillospiraceae bacterium]
MKTSAKKYRKGLCFTLIIYIALTLCGCGEKADDGMKDYGVFLSIGSSEMYKAEGYRTVVIDAQYFSEDDILHLKDRGSTVYSYLNIGSVEDFRDYYDEYSELTLGEYENWEGERWVNTASDKWQDFLVSLEEELLDKNIDGFFVDNCDVYYMYPTDEIFDGVTAVLEHLMEYGKPVIINGGDTYVMRYMEKYGSARKIMAGVNQESVWTRIDFESGELSESYAEDREYFEEYLKACSSDGADVYLIEYTDDPALKKQISEYCEANRFHYYISDSVELD